MKYPSDFPLPTVDGYGIDVDMGVLRTQFNTGTYRQRRTFNTMPMIFNLRFVVKLSMLHRWQVWVNQNGYAWFDVNMASYINHPDEHCAIHKIRLISNLALRPIARDVFEATVQAELEFGQAAENATGAAHHTNDWVIGGKPPAPSADWILGGTPPAPATDFYISGTPSAPSATV